MSEQFRALRLNAESPHCEPVQVSIEALSAGDIVIAPEYSAINYKDALAATGRAPILRVPSVLGGIDAAGAVVQSATAGFAIGQTVVVTGCGLSETRDGGFAERLRVPADFPIPVPPPHTARSAAIAGTAGLTAMLAIERLQEIGVTPQSGPVLVTGASGGVGSLSVLLLARFGYRVVAMTSKTDAGAALRALGAYEIREPSALAAASGALAKAEFAGAIDNLGGAVLPALARMTQPWGGVVSIGVACGTDFQGSVMPFVIRGVSILGVTSANCPQSRRQAAWARLFATLEPESLESVVADTVTLDELPARFADFLEGRGRGRTLVRIQALGA